MNILVLEDDEILNKTISESLTLMGDFSITSLTDGLQAKEVIKNNKFDLFLIDINLPGVDGLDILKYIKEKVKSSAPIIIISAYSDLEHISKGYELGCDDYLKKPFYIQELQYKIKKLFEVVKLDENLYYDKLKKRLLKNDEEIKLQKKEMELLEILIKNKNKTTTKKELLEKLYPSDGALRASIMRLRKIIGDDNLLTIPSVGYELVINN